jgi:hypothetical protein
MNNKRNEEDTIEREILGPLLRLWRRGRSVSTASRTTGLSTHQNPPAKLSARAIPAKIVGSRIFEHAS